MFLLRPPPFLPQLRMREPTSPAAPDSLTCLEVAYDQVEDQILAQVAHNSSNSSGSGNASTDADGSTASVRAAAAVADANNAASIDELVSSLLASGISGRRISGSAGSSPPGSSSSSGANSPSGSFSDLDEAVWLERFKGMSEAEALQELQVLKYLHDQTGVLRPRGAGGFAFSRGPAPAAAAATTGQKKKKRMTKANARRG